jgi:hypothetical protein
MNAMKDIARRILNVLTLLAWGAATFVTWMDRKGFGTFVVSLALGLAVVVTLNYVVFGKVTLWNETKDDE